jgi:glycerophosphoryl diester phosphodiesterase
LIAFGAATVLVATPAAPAAAGDDHRGHGATDESEPVLELRATLSADFLAPGPPSGAASTPANGRTPPYAGQVIPGFSGMIDNGDGTFWAMPDNGFGAKGNSVDFLLRLYHITPRWEGARGGAGQRDR